MRGEGGRPLLSVPNAVVPANTAANAVAGAATRPPKPSPARVRLVVVDGMLHPELRTWLSRVPAGRFMGLLAGAPEAVKQKLAHGVVRNLVTYSASVEAVLGRPAPDGYIVELYNVTYLCATVMTQECIQQYGPAGCWFAVTEGLTGDTGGSGSPAASPQNPVNTTNGGGGIGGLIGGGSGSSAPPFAAGAGLATRSSGGTAAIVGGVVGGVGGALLLLCIVLFAVWRQRKQRRQREQQLRACSKAYDSNGSTASYPTVHIGADGAPLTLTLTGKGLHHCDTAASQSHLHASLSLSGAASGLTTLKYPPASASLSPSPTEELSAAPTTTAHGSSSGNGTGTAAGPGRQQQRQQQQATEQRQGPEDGALEGQLRLGGADMHLAASGGAEGRAAGDGEQQQQHLTGSSPKALAHGEYGHSAVGKLATPVEPYKWDDPDGGSQVVVTPFTPHQPDVRMEVEHGTELQLLPKALGRGSFGRVVQGTYQGQLVAVKLVAEAHAANTHAHALAKVFAQEVEVLAPTALTLTAPTPHPPPLLSPLLQLSSHSSSGTTTGGGDASHAVHAA